MTTEPAAPDSSADYDSALQRDALKPPAVPGLARSREDEQAIALGRAVQLITEAHAQYSKSGAARPFFDFVRIVLTTQESK